jgi:hypothetical protein
MYVEDSVDMSKIYFLIIARRANVLVSCKILHESEEQARACVNAKYYTKRTRVKHFHFMAIEYTRTFRVKLCISYYSVLTVNVDVMDRYRAIKNSVQNQND